MSLRPWRTGAGPRPAGVPLPPERMPRWREGRPLKRWRYVGLYGSEVHLCVATARIAGMPLAWWAVWDRARGRAVEGTRRSHRGVAMASGRAAVADGDVEIEVAFEEGPGVETVSPHGRSYIWTRKQAPAMTARVRVAEHEHVLDGHGIVDDSAGYHARRTRWTWCAGAGRLESGDPVAWNLVEGVHDAPEASERTVWVAGRPHELGPVRFVAGLGGVEFAEGGALGFTAEWTRARRENLLVMASEYEQPFGAFAGSLPAAGRVLDGYGVMERHEVRW